ncbi:hypothetical protein PybrP1_010497, partial [[Pythium] brassicae (nom. inval.)]
MQVADQGHGLEELPARTVRDRWCMKRAFELVQPIEDCVAKIAPIHANVVVLSSNEKYTYAKVVFEPLLDHLTQLSSLEFYKQLASWEGVVTKALADLDDDTGAAAAAGDHSSDNTTLLDTDTDSESVMD